MRKKNINRLVIIKVFFIFLMNFLISLGFTQNTTGDYTDYEIIIKFDKNIEKELKAEDELIKKGV